MSKISVRNLTKKYGTAIALNNVSLEIESGEFLVLLGPSGCGKTTLLRCLAGLETPDAGEIIMGDTVVFSSEKNIMTPPGKRNLGMVFQSYALWPHMSVRDNVKFGLDVLKTPKPIADERLDEVLGDVGLGHLDQRYPSELSGGQQQRVALARLLATQPPVFLMDEPLSNLDARLRMDMRVELKRFQSEAKATTVYVTHDQTEAMTLADKIVVLQSGRIEQTGAPLDIYNNPQNVFVAGFIGSPRMNLIEATANQGADGWNLTAPNMSVPIPNVDGLTNGAHCTVGIRPEHVSIATEGSGHTKAQVAFAEQLGGETYLYCDVEGSPQITVHQPGQLPVIKGQTLALNFALENMHLFDANGQVIVNQVAR